MINLKIARIRRGMTQQQLAEKMNMRKADICRYETGRSKPPIDKLCRLADILNFSTDYLLGRKD